MASGQMLQGIYKTIWLGAFAVAVARKDISLDLYHLYWAAIMAFIALGNLCALKIAVKKSVKDDKKGK